MGKFEQPNREEEKVAFPKEHGDGRVLTPEELEEEHEKRLEEDGWREQK